MGLLLPLVFQSPTVRGGEEAWIPSAKPVVHARSGVGRVIERGERGVLWRAPHVCRHTAVPVTMQDSAGLEVSVDVAVTPSVEPSPLVVLPSASDDKRVLQGAGTSSLGFSVSRGELSALDRQGRCARAEWRMDSARFPDWEVAAAFDGGRLAAWEAVPRAAWTELTVRGPPGAEVRISVVGRTFVGRAGADGRGRVRIEVPPGVAHADGFEIDEAGRAQLIPIDLGPPPPTADHVITTSDGGRWLFRIDPLGNAFDGAQPPGAERVAVGVYRFAPAPSAPSVSAPVASLTAPVSAVPDAPVASTPNVERVTEPRDAPIDAIHGAAPIPELHRWRAAVAATLGLHGKLGGASWLERRFPFEPVDMAGMAAFFFSRTRYMAPERSYVALQEVAATALALEVRQSMGARPRAVASLGAGVAAVMRRSSLPSRASTSWFAAPLLTAALRWELGAPAIEARAWASTTALGAELSPWGLACALSWGFGP